MKVEILQQSGRLIMEESAALAFLETADLSQPVSLALQGELPRRVYVRPGTRPSKPLPRLVLDEFQYKSSLSGDDIFRMLSHGRSLVHTIEDHQCRFSVTADYFGRAVFHIHRFNPFPSVPGYQMTPTDIESLLKSRHLGHTIRLSADTVRTSIGSVRTSADTVRCFVSYDPILNDYVVLPADRIYIPRKLRGIVLSFRQRHALSCGRSIRLDRVSAQVDALTASICFTAV